MAHKIGLTKGQTTTNLLWNEYPGNPFSDDNINNINDNIGDLEIPVTSIPSPFAQMHLYEEAFRFINLKFKRNGQTALKGNSTYHKIVSNCLDIYEILYSYDLLTLADRVRFEIWEPRELDRLAKDSLTGVKTFAEALKVYIMNYNNDIRFKNNNIIPFNKITLIKLDRKIIAATSPYTGFYAIGDELPKDLVNLDNRTFFSNNLPLYLRNEDFQKFINLTFATSPEIIDAFSAVYDYIIINREFSSDRLHKLFDEIEDNETSKNIDLFNSEYIELEINNQNLYLLGNKIRLRYKNFGEEQIINMIGESDYLIRTRKQLTKPPVALLKNSTRTHWTYIDGIMPENINLENLKNVKFSDRNLPGSDIKYPCIYIDDLLSKYLVRLRYNINEAKFWTFNDNKAKNILPPVNPDYFRFFTLDDLKENISAEVQNTGRIVVKLKVPVKGSQNTGYITYERTYLENNTEISDDDNFGSISHSTLGFGIFPFFRVAETKYNDFYNILQYFHPREELKCSFIRQNNNYHDYGTVEISNETVRTRKEEGLNIITRYTVLSSFSRSQTGFLQIDTANITFDIVSIQWTFSDNGSVAYGLIIPLMGEDIRLQKIESSVAIDVGTSNSFVAFALAGSQPASMSTNLNPADPDSFQLTMLHQPERADDKKGSEIYDFNSRNAVEFSQPQYCEFMPVWIGEKSDYNFLIRTIINQDNDTDPTRIEKLGILSNINIPFAFNIKALRIGADVVFSNLKWGTSDPDNTSAKNRLQTFIEELVILSRNKILANGFDPELTKVIWFKPLSMTTDQNTVFNGIWQELYKKYFRKIDDNHSNLVSITESWAPFHSFVRAFGPGQVYLNIDIGGGTTDILVFKDGKPHLTSSFRFAGNSLFDSGMGDENLKDNGFVKKYKKIMDDSFKKTDGPFSQISEFIFDKPNLNSSDLISFYFTIKDFRDRLLLDNDFQLLFLIHNSAIFYHTMQMIKNIDNNLIPLKVGFSGNGSRLIVFTNRGLSLNNPGGISKIIREITKHIFRLEDTPKITLEMLEEPKESTAVGGIKGLKTIAANPNADLDCFYIAVGDKNTIIKNSDGHTKAQYQHSSFLDPQDTKIQNIVDNVMEFFSFFFDELWPNCQFVQQFGVSNTFNSRELKEYFCNVNKIESSIRSAINLKINSEHEQELSDSLFFYPIKSYLYEFSRLLVDENNRFRV